MQGLTYINGVNLCGLLELGNRQETFWRHADTKVCLFQITRTCNTTVPCFSPPAAHFHFLYVSAFSRFSAGWFCNGDTAELSARGPYRNTLSLASLVPRPRLLSRACTYQVESWTSMHMQLATEVSLTGSSLLKEQMCWSFITGISEQVCAPALLVATPL